MLRCAVGAEELLSLVQPRDGIVAAVVLGETQFVAGHRRGAGRRSVVSVEAALLVQKLCLDVLDGSGDEAGFLANGRDFPVMRLPRSPTIFTSLSNIASMEAWEAGALSPSSDIAVERWG